MTRKHIPLAMALAATLVVTGCGSSSDTDSASFIQDYNKAQEPLRGLVAGLDLASGKNRGDTDRFARDLVATADEFDYVRVRINQLDAPAGAQDEVATYLTELKSGAKEIRRLARAVEQRDAKRLTKVVGTFQAALTDVQQAEVSLSAAVE